MNWLYEDVSPLLWGSLLLAAMLAVAWYNTRQRGPLLGLLAVGLLALLAVVIETAVVTEREQVETTLYAAAAAVQANDQQAALSFIEDDATKLRTMVGGAMGYLRFSEARVTSNPKIEINHATPLPTATVKFVGRASVERGGSKSLLTHETFIRPCAVKLRRQPDGRWLLSECEIENYFQQLRDAQ